MLTVGIALAIFTYGNPAKTAASGISGTKVAITFEGLVGQHEFSDIPAGYDDLDWSGAFEVIGKGLYKQNEGFQSVIHRKVAAANIVDPYQGIISAESGTFSLKSGHFAAFGSDPVPVTFSAYRQGMLVGTKSVTLQPVDTILQFDHTFAHVDRITIDGVIALDNLHVSF
jgi:hypothetical protein